jgi:hypothetical protein
MKTASKAVRAAWSAYVVGFVTCSTASGEALRDPTQPPVAQSVKQSIDGGGVAALRVEGIFHAAGRQWRAIVDGRIVRCGDRVGGAVIQDITSDSVRYFRDGRSHVVRLKSSKLQVRRAGVDVKDPS